MVKRDRTRFPVHRTIWLKEKTVADLAQIAALTDEPQAEIIRRALDRQLPLFLDHASRTGKLMNGEVS